MLALSKTSVLWDFSAPRGHFPFQVIPLLKYCFCCVFKDTFTFCFDSCPREYALIVGPAGHSNAQWPSFSVHLGIETHCSNVSLFPHMLAAECCTTAVAGRPQTKSVGRTLVPKMPGKNSYQDNSKTVPKRPGINSGQAEPGMKFVGFLAL